MRLKKVEIVGFKSFADRTLVYFDKGVTCVVGPNGCGKSNISDSIRWVLGERSAKMLRGSKMEDVIFAGTQFRKPVAFAEVSLTIDNQDRGLPIDYNEVTITRRLHRSGESEYLINKTSCRLKDVQDLILDTGIGSNSYSMIEQGRIDHILNADAEERRFLIEEAAGISKYKVKKEEAIRKLERTEQNLLRLKDIVAEVQRNIQYAERQARRAERYREQFEKLKDLEIRRAFFDLGQISAVRSELEEARGRYMADIEGIVQAIAEIRNQQEGLAQGLSEIMEKYSAIEGQRYDLKGRFDQNDQQLRFNQEKRVEFASRKGQIHQERIQLDQQLMRSQAEIEVKNEEVVSIGNQKSDVQTAFETARLTLEQAENHLEASKTLFNDSKAASFEAASEAAKVRNDYHRLCAYLDSQVEQRKKQDAGATRYQQELEQWAARKIDCEKSLRELEERVSLLSEQKAAQEEQLKSLKAELESYSDKIESAERQLHEMQTRRAMLKEIDEAAGLSQETLLEGFSEEERSLMHQLRDLIKVESGYEAAVESVLGDFAKALVTENGNAAYKLLAEMSARKSAPAAFLVKSPESVPAPEETAAVQDPQGPLYSLPISRFVSMNDAYRPLLNSFFNSTFVIENLTEENFLEAVRGSAQCRLVTKDGTVLGPAGRLFFRQGQISAEQNLFKRGSEIEDLTQQIAARENDLEQWQTAAARILSLGEELQEALKVTDHTVMESKLQRESFEQLRKGLQDRLGTFQRELDLIFSEQEEMRVREEEAVAQRTQLEIDMMRTEEKQRQIRSEQENIVRDMERMERTKAEAVRDYSDQKAKLDALRQREKFLEEACRLLSEQQGRDRARIENLEAETLRIQEREEILSQEDGRVRQEQDELAAKIQEADLQLAMVRQDRDRIQQEMQQIEQMLVESQDRKHQNEEALHEVEKRGMDLGYQEKNIHERLLQSYKIELQSLQPELYALSEEELSAVSEQVDELRRKIESIGTVNLLAIEEYDELKQRHDFLMGQQKDLEDARDSLMEAIRKINRTTKGLFETTFQEVQKAFGEYYQTLFRGGEAKLVLIDETNPLESGVDIHVRPPGKKLQHMSLLSGGEKAMTAMALLFSLFKIKPSPFCVLDEVDAPLDEANVDRFLAVLRTFLKSSQFIIVTHNRKTIAMGDSLYGVTMQEAGVSKIVSVKVSQDAKNEAFQSDESGVEPAESESEPEAGSDAEDAGEPKSDQEILESEAEKPAVP